MNNATFTNTDRTNSQYQVLQKYYLNDWLVWGFAKIRLLGRVDGVFGLEAHRFYVSGKCFRQNAECLRTTPNHVAKGIFIKKLLPHVRRQ